MKRLRSEQYPARVHGWQHVGRSGEYELYQRPDGARVAVAAYRDGLVAAYGLARCRAAIVTHGLDRAFRELESEFSPRATHSPPTRHVAVF